jgi:hypothetical protein
MDNSISEGRQQQSWKEPVDIDRIVRSSNDDQYYLIEKWARLVRAVLSNVEISIPEERQYFALKKLLNTILYDSRNVLLRFFDDSCLVSALSPEVITKHIQDEVDMMLGKMNGKFELAFSDKVQQFAVKDAVQGAVSSIIADVCIHFVKAYDTE